MPNKKWMLYGCYGYSGALIVEHALSKGLTPIVAGRSHAKVQALADRYQLEARVFDLDKPSTIVQHIEDCALVFNAAGPYTSTCLPFLKACLATGSHYLSLVGEIPMLESLQSWDGEARRSGIMIAIGLGYDVHPTDCLANLVCQELPNAVKLRISMDGSTEMSPGSYKEFIEQVGEQPFWERRDHALVKGKAVTEFLQFPSGKKLSSTIAWGDLSSAYHSTGIPNIEVFASMSYFDWGLMKVISGMAPMLKYKSVQNRLNKLVDKLVDGPSEKERESSISYLRAEAWDDDGKSACVSCEMPSAYKLTYLSAVYAIEKVLNQEALAKGFVTPAQLLGPSSIFDIEGVTPAQWQVSN